MVGLNRLWGISNDGIRRDEGDELKRRGAGECRLYRWYEDSRESRRRLQDERTCAVASLAVSKCISAACLRVARVCNKESDGIESLELKTKFH